MHDCRQSSSRLQLRGRLGRGVSTFVPLAKIQYAKYMFAPVIDRRVLLMGTISYLYENNREPTIAEAQSRNKVAKETKI